MLFRIQEARIEVISVWHGHGDPERWRARLTSEGIDSRHRGGAPACDQTSPFILSATRRELGVRPGPAEKVACSALCPPRAAARAGAGHGGVAADHPRAHPRRHDNPRMALTAWLGIRHPKLIAVIETME
jgi:hypothetical protein